jgi:hypothetical protein
MQIKKSTIPRNTKEIPKCVKICRIKLNFSNDNAAIRGDYYFLSIYTVRNKICIYMKTLDLVMSLQIPYEVQTLLTS